MISRVPTSKLEAPFEVVALDLIEQSPLASAKWVLHFLYWLTAMNHVYVLLNKTQEAVLQTVQDYMAYIRIRWDYQVRVF